MPAYIPEKGDFITLSFDPKLVMNKGVDAPL
jgi:hypothetical protein